MKDYPLISVIVPVYKAEEYLDQCIGSIANQTYPNLEILLVDDGSPGNSGAICDVWAEKDSRIRVIHKENGGTGQARNVAMDLAKGEFLAFLDCDDYIAPDMYAHLYSIMDAQTDLAECAFQETFDDHAAFSEGSANVTYYTPEEAMRQHIRDTVFRQIVWNKLYRRSAVGDIRFISGIKLDDEFFTYRVIANCRKLVLSDKRCHAYRQHPSSVIHQKYSLDRVLGLKAKQLRLELVQMQMPALLEEAGENLLMSCLFSAQGTLRCLKGKEREQARTMIREVKDQIPAFAIGEGLSLKRKLLLKAIRRNLEGTAKMMNFLMDIHVLK